MQNWFLRLLLAGIMGVAGLVFCPTSAAATLNPSPPLERLTPYPIVVSPSEGDFSDAAFAKADQPALGLRIGGDAGGVLVLVLVVVLLILLILWLVNAGGEAHVHERIEIRGGGEIHEGGPRHEEHESHMGPEHRGR